jgi:ABC-2 type transport system permease protein
LHKILLIAKRDYLATIRTKAFLFGLLVAPILFGGSFLGIALTKGKPDIRDRRIAVVDWTGVSGATVIQAMRNENSRNLFDKATGRQTMPRYEFENVPPDAVKPDEQRLALSDRVRRQELFAFVEIGAHALEPGGVISWYSNEGGIGRARQWSTGPLNDGLRQARLIQLGVDTEHFDRVFTPVTVDTMSLVSRDAKTGRIGAALKKGTAESLGISVVPAALLLMIVMFTTAPMLPAIAEDKMQRVFEMLLPSATPFQLVAGKILAAVGRSLTSAVIYVAGAVLVMNMLTMLGLVPFELLPWFLIYLVAEVTMLSAVATGLGAACGSPQDAQSLGIVLISPVMISLFLMEPVLQQPNGSLATAMSLFPPFTPILMLVRQASPGGVPAWQPLAGLAGVLIASVAISWIAARIFRIGILLQGKPPGLSELLRWAIRG